MSTTDSRLTLHWYWRCWCKSFVYWLSEMDFVELHRKESSRCMVNLRYESSRALIKDRVFLNRLAVACGFWTNIFPDIFSSTHFGTWFGLSALKYLSVATRSRFVYNKILKRHPCLESFHFTTFYAFFSSFFSWAKTITTKSECGKFSKHENW